METRSLALDLFRRGLFADVLPVLERRPYLDRVLRLEVLRFVGRPDEAADAAKEEISRGNISSADRARCLAVVASWLHDKGDMVASLECSQRALQAADESRHSGLIAAIASQLLERSCDRTAFSASLPLAAIARKAAARSGDPQVLALVHLRCGRLEARQGHLDSAKRHFALGRRFLSNEPNNYLYAAFDIDESCLLSMSGDFAAACELALSGAAAAARSGWSLGKCAAAATLACIYVALGRLEDAEHQIVLARTEPFPKVAYEVSLADTEAQIAMARGLYATAEDVFSRLEPLLSGAPYYYGLYVRQTRIQLLLWQGRWEDVLAVADRSIDDALRAGAESLASSFRFSRCQALVQLGVSLESATALLEIGPGVYPSLAVLRGYYTALGEALCCSGSERGREHLARAERLRVQQHISSMPRNTGEDEIRANTSSQHLDSAVALLELAGHPHILGREAVALINDTRCATSVALLAADETRLRIVEAQGWTDDDALAAARAAARDELIPIGLHRSETWQILAVPGPDLDQRCTLASIRKLLATAVALDGYRRDEKQRAALWPPEALGADPESIWASEQAAELLSIARRIANAPVPVLLTGETGTGKEMLARAIHRASDRADKPLIPFNCSAVPRDMLESQLFGYRKGAFTGANAPFPGVIRAAAGGTLFLDEIADIGLDLQPKLLRFFEYHEIHPLGEPQPIKVDVRIIAATNADLDQAVAQGRFREDLYYRLKVVHLKLPPLRERREEIPTLLQHYIQRYADEHKKGRLTLSDETLEYLLLYSWPGNIRQLANEVRRMVAMAEADSTLTPALLSPEIQASRRTVPASPAAEPEVRLRIDQPLPAAVETLEQILVRRALERTQGRVEEAARMLGISRKGLFLKRRRWGIRQAS